MIRRLFCLILLVTAVSAAVAGTPKRVGNYSSLMKALKNGSTVSVVMEFGRCNLLSSGDQRLSPPLAGGLVADTWTSRVESSQGNQGVTLVLTGDELVAHPGRGMLRRHVEVSIGSDDQVTIALRHLDPGSYEVVSTWRLATTFDRGDDGAAAFYLLD